MTNKLACAINPEVECHTNEPLLMCERESWVRYLDGCALAEEGAGDGGEGCGQAVGPQQYGGHLLICD